MLRNKQTQADQNCLLNYYIRCNKGCFLSKKTWRVSTSETNGMVIPLGNTTNVLLSLAHCESPFPLQNFQSSLVLCPLHLQNEGINIFTVNFEFCLYKSVSYLVSLLLGKWWHNNALYCTAQFSTLSTFLNLCNSLVAFLVTRLFLFSSPN